MCAAKVVSTLEVGGQISANFTILGTASGAVSLIAAGLGVGLHLLSAEPCFTIDPNTTFTLTASGLI